MSTLQEILGSRSSFILAALAMSWIAFALLALVAANLHFRLAHLERSRSASDSRNSRTPFAHLLGRSLAEVLGPRTAPATRIALVLASNCSSCERLLGELRKRAPSGVTLLWRDELPSPLPELPVGVTLLDDGARVCRELGVGVAPFVLCADEGGRIVRAAPIGSAKVLAELLTQSEAAGGPPATVPTTEPHTETLRHQPLKGVS